MKVTVFGSSGKVGRLVVPLLLKAGHQVTLFSRQTSPFATNDNVTMVLGDIHDGAAVQKALQNCEVLISALGSWHTPTKDILTAAMRSAIPAMQANGAKRLISLTGSGAHAPGDNISMTGKISHAVFSVVANKIITDAEEHLRLLNASTLDWTVLRAPVMRNAASDSYVLNSSLPKAWETINRQAVAAALVAQLTDTNHYHNAPHIHHA